MFHDPEIMEHADADADIVHMHGAHADIGTPSMTCITCIAGEPVYPHCKFRLNPWSCSRDVEKRHVCAIMWGLGWSLFTFFVSKFCSPFFPDKVWYADFKNCISFFFNLERNRCCRPFESQFWPVLTVSVMLCSVQPQRASRHLIMWNYHSFASFWTLVY